VQRLSDVILKSLLYITRWGGSEGAYKHAKGDDDFTVFLGAGADS
jgi:hypothetical protein